MSCTAASAIILKRVCILAFNGTKCIYFAGQYGRRFYYKARKTNLSFCASPL